MSRTIYKTAAVGSALAALATAGDAMRPIQAQTPTGRMMAQIKRKAAQVAANPKVTAEQKAWNDRVEAKRRARKAPK